MLCYIMTSSLWFIFFILKNNYMVKNTFTHFSSLKRHSTSTNNANDTPYPFKTTEDLYEFLSSHHLEMNKEDTTSPNNNVLQIAPKVFNNNNTIVNHKKEEEGCDGRFSLNPLENEEGVNITEIHQNFHKLKILHKLKKQKSFMGAAPPPHTPFLQTIIHPLLTLPPF